VTTPFGYHLIQVLEHTQATNKPLEEVKTEIQEALTNQKKQQMATNYLAELRKKAKIIDATDEVSKK
jgi:parvulin-like peptidyl-prolyl isomerase